jgi:hypothetical protein
MVERQLFPSAGFAAVPVEHVDVIGAAPAGASSGVSTIARVRYPPTGLLVVGLFALCGAGKPRTTPGIAPP